MCIHIYIHVHCACVCVCVCITWVGVSVCICVCPTHWKRQTSDKEKEIDRARYVRMGYATMHLMSSAVWLFEDHSFHGAAYWAGASLLRWPGASWGQEASEGDREAGDVILRRHYAHHSQFHSSSYILDCNNGIHHFCCCCCCTDLEFLTSL